MLKFVNLVLKENLLGSPFAPNKQYFDPAIGAALINGGASLLSSIFGGASTNSAQREANETNLQIARETNKANYEMHQSDIAQQERMWKLQNEYNDPSNVVARLQRAGINPATAYGNISTPASAMSVPSGAPQQAAQVSPVNGFGHEFAQGIHGAFQGAIDAYNQSRLATSAIKESDERTHGITLDNEEKQRGMSDRLEYLQKMAKEKGYLGELAKTQLDFELKAFNVRQAMLGADYTMQLKQINLAQEQFNQARLQNELYKIQVAYAPKLNDAQLKQYYETVNQIKAQIGLINANKLLTDEQRAHEIEKKCGTIIQNGLTGLDFKLKEATQDFVKQQAHLTTERMKMENSKFGRSFRIGSLEFSPRGDYELTGKQWWPF